MPYKRISVDEAKGMMADGNVTVIDVRDPGSFQSGAIDGAVHISNENVQDFIAGADKSQPLLVCCYHGNMSQGAADYFSEQGFAATYSIDVGYEAWRVAT